ncbi:MAG TPA: hypothetical protein VEB66_08455, partial [Opitutaceae bacterium]|nr:hypothetical protein [Opitutaceae bacterium]
TPAMLKVLESDFARIPELLAARAAAPAPVVVAPPPAVAAPAPAVARSTRAPFGEGPCPLALWLNLPHAFVAGHASTLVFRVQNEGALPLENGEVYVSSRGLSGESISRFRRLAPAARHELLLEIEASRAGHFVLQLALSWDQGGQRYAYRGQHPLRIYKAPENSNIVINISDIQSNTGGGANQALGAEYGDVQISNLIAKGAIKTVNDLLDLELPENFQRVELDLDYEVSRQDLGSRAPSRAGGLQVPPALLGTVQAATVCTFETVGAGAPPLPFRLVARPQFRLGRARADADFVAWVLPRSTGNDEKTMRVSKVQAIAEATRAGVVLRDNASANGTLFDGVPLDEHGTSLSRQGRLLLAGAVEVDFHRLPPASDHDPVLANARAWPGPAPTAAAQRGAVRFEVVAAEEQPLNAVWLLTDAAFGTSRSNAVALSDPALAEVQGRFHHYRGSFWIETLADNSAVQLDRLTLRPGEIAPLATGQQLRIGTRIWRLKLEA